MLSYKVTISAHDLRNNASNYGYSRTPREGPEIHSSSEGFPTRRGGWRSLNIHRYRGAVALRFGSKQGSGGGLLLKKFFRERDGRGSHDLLDV